jgi:hypothetical protein
LEARRRAKKEEFGSNEHIWRRISTGRPSRRGSTRAESTPETGCSQFCKVFGDFEILVRRLRMKGVRSGMMMGFAQYHCGGVSNAKRAPERAIYLVPVASLPIVGALKFSSTIIAMIPL